MESLSYTQSLKPEEVQGPKNLQDAHLHPPVVVVFYCGNLSLLQHYF